MQSVEHAIQEMKFARKELGMRGGFMRPNPYNETWIAPNFSARTITQKRIAPSIAIARLAWRAKSPKFTKSSGVVRLLNWLLLWRINRHAEKLRYSSARFPRTENWRIAIPHRASPTAWKN